MNINVALDNIEEDTGPTLEEVMDIAREAINLAEKHQTPPVPETYDVWYAYATRSNEAITTFINQALEHDRPLRPTAMRELYDQHLSPRVLSDELADIGDVLSDEITRAFGALESGIEGNSGYSEGLRSAIKTLSIGTIPKDDLKALAGSLYRANQAHLATQRQMGDTLTEAKNRVQCMEKELAELRRSAFIDHLTQLPNRRRLDEVLDKAIEFANLNRIPLCFALADIDRFKRVNDTWGHGAGDNILKRFGRILKANVKGKDTAARYGGEEFALVLPSTPLDAGKTLTDQIRAAMEEIEWVSEKTEEKIGTVTVSFGVTVLRPGEKKVDMINRADQLLYEAKGAGRNQSIARP